MNIKNKRTDEFTFVDKKYVKICAGLKDGGAIVLETYRMNPFEALFVLDNYLSEKEMVDKSTNINS